jgi:formyl-CoA transferase
MSVNLFAGLKVIDCASWIAGPAAATIMSDFGADVIKIEPPGVGDPWRGRGPNPKAPTDYYWQLTSRNKRSLAIDLKHDEGRAALHKLVSGADASFTAYGEAGEEAAKTGFDSTAYWARTGLMDMVRAYDDYEPVRSMPGMGDHPSATGLYAAIVTALYRREKTGQGGLVQSSLLQNGLWANGCAVQTRLFGDEVPHRPTRMEVPNALANHYRTSDDRWFIMALYNEQRQLKGFMEAIGRPELTSDPRFATDAARKQNARALVEVLDDVFATRTLAEWRAALDGVGVTFGIVGKVDEVLHDPQMVHAGALVPFADGQGLTVSAPFHLEGEDKVAPRRAPAIGQHSDVVLAEAGYSADEIGRLRSLGVLA